MKPTSKQVEEISALLAPLMEDSEEESFIPNNAISSEPVQEEGQMSEALLARMVAKSLASEDGVSGLRGFLVAAQSLLRSSFEGEPLFPPSE